MRRFKAYTINEFKNYINNIQVEREITHVQYHHTWRPTKNGFYMAKEKEKVIWSIWKYHTSVRFWQDIAQHFTISPDGMIWDGRSLELDPAGIKGHNKGGIMIEMIGNFDIGQEKLDNGQLYAATKAGAILVEKFNLTTNDIVFHNEFSNKTCPGSSINKDMFVGLIQNIIDTELNKFDKTDGLKYLAKQGIIENPERWLKKLDEPIPIWAVTTILARIYKGVKNK
jgi:hypothetical protein